MTNPAAFGTVTLTFTNYTMKKALIAVGVVILIGGVGYFGYRLGKIRNAAVNSSGTVTSVASESGLPATSSSPAVATGVLPADLATSIVWHAPQKISSLGLAVSSSDFNDADVGYISHIENQTEYFSVGSYTYQGKSGSAYFLSAAIEGPSFPEHFILVNYNNQLVLLSKYSDQASTSTADIKQTSRGLIGKDGFFHDKFVIDTAFTVPAFEFPTTISGSLPRQVLTLDAVTATNVSSRFGIPASQEANPIQAFRSSVVGQVYVSTSTNGFYVLPPGPLAATYRLVVDFYDQDSQVPHITFSDGSTNSKEYSYTSIGGCGSSNFLAVVDPQTVNPATDLVSVGTTNHGDSIFELKDSQHQRLQDTFKSFPTDPPQSYDQFIASRPLLYWVDPFGRLVELRNTKYQPQAECGKPVIYLYPQKTTAVSVKLAPKGGFTYSEPAYNNGWNVAADPESNLTDLSTGKLYPYLFWEGRGGLYQAPKQGWVVTQSAVPNFLAQKLAELGLNRKESADFMEFWLPRMQTKPYYFITFMGNQTMNEIAPLTIEPKPDTTIRILMDFTPLEAPINVESFRIHTPTRKGFTVVEWGGVVR